jgi:hypothetical protein
MIGVRDVSYILDDIESRLIDVPDIKPLPFDKWLVSSCLQKSIRRGCVADAVSCTGNLWQIDRQMLWRRISIITLEDIGIGDIDAVSEILAVCSDWKWRRKVGDLRAASYLAGRMAEANKSRSITHAYMIAEMSPAYQKVREDYAGLENNELADIALNKTQRLINRAIALWYLSGSRYPSDTLHRREGSLDAAIDVMVQMDAPYHLTQTCLLNLKRVRWSGVLLAPLMYEVLGGKKHEVILNDLPKYKTVEGMPTFACDGLYTRLGKACVREWKKQCPVFDSYKPVQIGHALFYTESGELNKERLSESLWTLKRESTKASLSYISVQTDEQEHLLGIARKYLPELNDIRAQRLADAINCTGC